MRKPFNQDILYYWYSDYFVCAWCGKAHANSFHHAINDGDFADSILNATPMNNEECHLPNHSILKKEENVEKFLGANISFLLSRGYLLTNLDRDFINIHSDIYKRIL